MIIMSENVNREPVADVEEAGQVEEQLSMEEKQELMKYYLRQLEMMYPIAAPRMADRAGLVTLQRRNTHLIEMLTLFSRSWAEEITVIQKAVLQYLTSEGIPKKERQQVIEVWGNWTTFLLDVSRYQGLLTRYLQYHHRQVGDLKKLLEQDNCI